VILKMEDVSNMKGKIIGSFGVLWLFLIVVVLAAVWRFAPTYNVRAEEAGCTKSGKASYVNGVPTCDCTIETEATCSCVFPCPPKND
jgi:hypothetical protein